MTKKETIRNLEKKYHVIIDKDISYGPFSNEPNENFKIYSADRSCFDHVIGYRSLVRTLSESKKFLAQLAKDYVVRIVSDNRVIAEVPEIDAEKYLEENGLDWISKTDTEWKVESIV